MSTTDTYDYEQEISIQYKSLSEEQKQCVHAMKDAARDGDDGDLMLSMLHHAEALQVDVNQRDQYGRSALHLAASRGNVITTEVLLAHGAIASLPDGRGTTPLHVATIAGFSGIVERMLGSTNAGEGELHLLQEDSLGKTPLDWVTERLRRLYTSVEARQQQQQHYGNTADASNEPVRHSLVQKQIRQELCSIIDSIGSYLERLFHSASLTAKPNIALLRSQVEEMARTLGQREHEITSTEIAAVQQEVDSLADLLGNMSF